MKELKKEEKKLELFIAKAPDSLSVHFFKGAFYLDKGLYMDAILEFKKLLKDNPDSPIVREILNSIYLEIGLN